MRRVVARVMLLGGVAGLLFAGAGMSEAQDSSRGGPGGAASGSRTPSTKTAHPATRTSLVYGDIYLEHKPAKGHPEKPERVEAIIARLRKDGLFEKLNVIEPRPAALEWIETIHSRPYIERVKAACERGEKIIDTPDVSISRKSYDAALAATGGVLAAVDAVMEGKSTNAFCPVRPPGHHALANKAMGFCIFGNVAIAARYLQQKHKVARVLIIDWDVHHGNGTQAAFDADPTIFYFSIHRSPFYPGTGGAQDIGTGAARGTKLNIPLPAGTGDADYVKAFKEKLIPAARAFKPEFVLLSAGFDAHADDPLGGMKVTAKGYAELTRIVKSIAAEQCGGKLVSVLEGGYNTEALAEAVEEHVKGMME